MPRIVAPRSVGDVRAIELVEAVGIDVDAIPPPVDTPPKGRADGNGPGKSAC